MNDSRSRKFKAVIAAVNEVLYKDWAPIGFVGALPRDEYESYAVRVVAMLKSGADENELAAYLADTGSSLGGNPMSAESIRPIAKRLLGFREEVRVITRRHCGREDALT